MGQNGPWRWERDISITSEIKRHYWGVNQKIFRRQKSAQIDGRLRETRELNNGHKGGCKQDEEIESPGGTSEFRITVKKAPSRAQTQSGTRERDQPRNKARGSVRSQESEVCKC